MSLYSRYSVLVGNIGTVYEGPSRILAWYHFEQYKMQSDTQYGRAAGEDVSILRDGEPIREHIGALRS